MKGATNEQNDIHAHAHILAVMIDGHTFAVDFSFLLPRTKFEYADSDRRYDRKAVETLLLPSEGQRCLSPVHDLRSNITR